MSADNKTRFEVQRIIRNAIIAALKYDGYDPDKYVVMEANQRSITAKKEAILFKMTDSQRHGWQATKFRVEKDDEGVVTDFLKDDCFIDEQTWLISVMTKRPNTDNNPGTITAETRLSEDVAQSLIAWFNGPGCFELRKEGVSNLYIKEKPVEVYKDDSSLYEKSASFRIKLLIPKRITHESPAAEVEFKGFVPI